MNHEMPNSAQSAESVIQGDASNDRRDTCTIASIINIANVDDGLEANILHNLESIRQQLGSSKDCRTDKSTCGNDMLALVDTFTPMLVSKCWYLLE